MPKVGDKIELVSTTDKYPPVPVGAKGQIKGIISNDEGKHLLKIAWEKGKDVCFNLLLPNDEIKVVS